MFQLKNKIAIVTGASRGLGFAMAQGLAEQGADIFNVGRNDDPQIRSAIEKTGRKYYFYQANLSKLTKETSDLIVERAVSVYGKVDILLNNAGGTVRSPFLDFKEDDWDYVTDLNLKSVYLLSQSVANQMIKQKSKGKIINIASMLSYTGGFEVAAYTTTKTAIVGLTRAMATELSKYNINCNAIAPGYMKTEMTKIVRDNPERNKLIMDRLPIGYWGDPNELKGPVVFLASDASDYVCGVTLPVDGGWISR